MAKKDKKKKDNEEIEEVEKKPKKNRDWMFIAFLIILSAGVVAGYKYTSNMSPTTSNSSSLVFRGDMAETAEEIVETSEID